MIPDPGTTFVVRLHTNEMMERERLAALLAAIESAARDDEALGPRAVLLVGAVRPGSLELILAIVGAVTGITSVILAIPGFLLTLKQLSKDKREDPNPFAVAIAEAMVLDGVVRADLIHTQRTVSINREDVPFVRRLEGLSPFTIKMREIERDQLDVESQDNGKNTVEDEDQDWLPAIEASDHPPREVRAGSSGFLNGIRLIGEFIDEEVAGDVRLVFIPRDAVIAPYFIVTSNSYESAPVERVEYEVIANVVVDGAGATMEVLSINPPEDPLLELRM